MKDQDYFINSVNLNDQAEFPYLVLNVEDDISYPLNPGFRVMHWHADLQFIYVIKGKICVKSLYKKEIISEGEGIFINKNIVHMVEKIESCKYKNFIFPDFFVSFYIGSPAARFTQSITENTGISMVPLYDDKLWQYQALAVLRELSKLEETERTKLYPYEVLSKLSKLWLLILQNVTVSNPRDESITSIRTRRFLQYIENHYQEKVTLEELASSADVSKSECLRCFKSTLQTTPYKYLMDYRLCQAARLLKKTSLAISEIAIQTGFDGQSYFGKCFREKMNCSPSDYRKQ